MRDRIWAALSRVGWTEARWRALPPWQRRATKVGIVGVVGVLVLAPLYGFDAAAYLSFVTIVALYVPSWGRVRYGRFVLPLAVFALCVAYPYYLPHMPKLPIFTAFPSMTTAFTMTIYVMMALGLNIVVGYAGLLDLGYVAFYAIGAYTAAWLASPQADRYHWTVNFGSVGVPAGLGGIHISIW